jgi:hypothetical protein
VAQQRQQQFRKLPGSAPHESASLSVGPIEGMQKAEGRMEIGRIGFPFFIPHPAFCIRKAPVAQYTERARPKRQVAGESPAGDTISRVWFNSRMRPCQGRDDGATPFTCSSFWGRSSASQSGCFTCIRSKARFLLPSPFLSLWCSPANTPASQAGVHQPSLFELRLGEPHWLAAPKRCRGGGCNSM